MAEKKLMEHTFFVKGMHCASCEILVEKKLLELKQIKSVEASASRGAVMIGYQGEKPGIKRLNDLFLAENYVFSDGPPLESEPEQKQKNDLWWIIGGALFVIASFILLNRTGFSGLININAKSSLPVFFIFGAIAGISSCAALVGGLVLSMSKQWSELYADRSSGWVKFQPHLIFNAGRLLAYAFFGLALGFIGNKLQISFKFTSILTMIVSVLMIFLALQMLGVKVLRRFQPVMPKFTSRFIADEKNFRGRYLPFLMGGLTFFLPCGFTITSQGLALLSGSPLQGSLIMLFFALGTMPALLLIGYSSVKFNSRPRLAYRFTKLAGWLVLFFALFNINSQLNVLGATSFNDLIFKSVSPSAGPTGEQPAEAGNAIQIIKMDASASGYSPNYFKVKAGQPVQWEITDKGTSGCTNAVIARSLFEGEIKLIPGQTVVKAFTPSKPGRYKFSCWMGMISGIIEVVNYE